MEIKAIINIVSVSLILIGLLGSAFAQDVGVSRRYCVSNTTIQHNITYEYCIGGTCRILSDILNEDCKWGCNPDEQRCNPSPVWKGIIVLGILVAGGFITKLFGMW